MNDLRANPEPHRDYTAEADRDDHPSLLDVIESNAAPDRPGRDVAEHNTDAWWSDTAARGIRHLAAGGAEFEAFDLIDIGVPEPDHPNRWGAALAHACRDGVIVCVGAGPSRRPTRAGGLCRRWRGVQR